MGKSITIKRINISLFFLFLLINYFQPLIVDDLCRSAISALYNHTVINSLIQDYNGWTGRMAAEVLVYIFFNKAYEVYLILLFNVINAFFLVSFFNIIFNISIKNNLSKKSSGNFLVFVCIFLCVLIFTGFFKNAIWKTVGLQYFWGIYLLAYLFFDQFYQQKPKLNSGIILLLSGLFIGLYNEIYFAIVLIFGCVYLFGCLLNSEKLGIKNQIVFLIGNFIGGVILVFAPGNYVRQNIIHPGHITLNDKLYGLASIYLGHKVFLIIVAFVIFLVLLDKQKSRLIRIIVSFSIILMVLVFLPISGTYTALGDRMLMLQYVIISVLAFQYLFSLNLMGVLINKIPLEVLLLPSVIILSIVIYAYYGVFIFNNKRHAQIVSHHASSDAVTVSFDRYKPKFKFFADLLVYFDDIGADSSDWKNRCFANYYNNGALYPMYRSAP